MTLILNCLLLLNIIFFFLFCILFHFFLLVFFQFLLVFVFHVFFSATGEERIAKCDSVDRNEIENNFYLLFGFVNNHETGSHHNRCVIVIKENNNRNRRRKCCTINVAKGQCTKQNKMETNRESEHFNGFAEPTTIGVCNSRKDKKNSKTIRHSIVCQ